MINLFLANLLPKCIGFVAGIYLVKFLDVNEMGVLGIFTSVIAILTPLMSGRLVLMLSTVSSKEELLELSKTSHLITFIVLIFIAPISGYLISSKITTVEWFFSTFIIACWLAGTHLKEFIEHSALRNRNFRRIKNIYLFNSLNIQLARLVMAFYTGFGHIVAATHGAVIFFAGTYLFFKFGLKETIPKKINDLKNIKAFGLRSIILVMTQLLSTASSYSPILLTAYLFDNTKTGIVTGLFFLILIPLKAFFQSFGKYIFAEVTSKSRSDTIKVVPKKSLFCFLLLPISWSLCLLIFPFLNYILVPLLGDNWIEIHDFFDVIFFLVVVQMAQCGTGLIFKALEKDLLNLILNFIRFFAIFTLVIVFHDMHEFFHFFELYSVFVGFTYLVSYLSALYLIYRRI